MSNHLVTNSLCAYLKLSSYLCRTQALSVIQVKENFFLNLNPLVFLWQCRPNAKSFKSICHSLTTRADPFRCMRQILVLGMKRSQNILI